MTTVHETSPRQRAVEASLKARGLTRRVERTAVCGLCTHTFPVKPGTKGKYCSLACYWKALRGHVNAPTVWGALLFDRWRESGLTMAGFARSIGTSPQNLSAWLGGKLPEAETLDQLRPALGEIPPFETATDKGRKRAEANLEALADPKEHPVHPAQSADARRKRAASLRGKPKSPEHAAKVAATLRANGTYATTAERMTGVARSVKRRLVSALMGYLSGNPTPDLPTLRQWADAAGERHDLPGDAVMAVWRPYLQRRGLLPKQGGRPGKIDYPSVHEWRTANPPVKWEIIATRLGRDVAVLKNGYGRWKGKQTSSSPA